MKNGHFSEDFIKKPNLQMRSVGPWEQSLQKNINTQLKNQ